MNVANKVDELVQLLASKGWQASGEAIENAVARGSSSLEIHYLLRGVLADLPEAESFDHETCVQVQSLKAAIDRVLGIGRIT